jgi:hypothetical protein
MKEIDKKATETLLDLTEELRNGIIDVNDYTYKRDKIFGKQTLLESVLLPIIGVYVEKSRDDTDE